LADLDTALQLALKWQCITENPNKIYTKIQTEAWANTLNCSEQLR